jgi:hypothetical protein
MTVTVWLLFCFSKYSVPQIKGTAAEFSTRSERQAWRSPRQTAGSRSRSYMGIVTGTGTITVTVTITVTGHDHGHGHDHRWFIKYQSHGVTDDPKVSVTDDPFRYLKCKQLVYFQSPCDMQCELAQKASPWWRADTQPWCKMRHGLPLQKISLPHKLMSAYTHKSNSSKSKEAILHVTEGTMQNMSVIELDSLYL